MKKTIIYRRITFTSALVLLMLLLAVQLIPLTYNIPNLVGQESLQGTRAQRIAKDALVLAYRPATEHTQAINEIQNTLPLWEQEQNYLGTFHNPTVQAFMTQAQPDYLAIDTAAHNLLAQPADMTQMAIIIQHERNYSLAMNQLATFTQERIQEFKVDVTLVQCCITVFVTATVVGLFLLSRQNRKDLL